MDALARLQNGTLSGATGPTIREAAEQFIAGINGDSARHGARQSLHQLAAAEREKARDRIATPSEAATLIAALPARDRAALGLSVYAGLRLGEILALDWSAIDLERQAFRVVRALDPKARVCIDAKTEAGHNRAVPIVDRLAVLLADHRVLTPIPSPACCSRAPGIRAARHRPRHFAAALLMLGARRD